jgi:hypothetical protein
MNMFLLFIIFLNLNNNIEAQKEDKKTKFPILSQENFSNWFSLVKRNCKENDKNKKQKKNIVIASCEKIKKSDDILNTVFKKYFDQDTITKIGDTCPKIQGEAFYYNFSSDESSDIIQNLNDSITQFEKYNQRFYGSYIGALSIQPNDKSLYLIFRKDHSTVTSNAKPGMVGAYWNRQYDKYCEFIVVEISLKKLQNNQGVLLTQWIDKNINKNYFDN